MARESADIILLSRDLDVLRSGVADGRKTFANTLKYISITTSANFGNMISMAVATPLLPFLPLAATQILLNNFLSDLPSIAISSDNVDPERVRRPQRWMSATSSLPFGGRDAGDVAGLARVAQRVRCASGWNARTCRRSLVLLGESALFEMP